MDRVVTPKIDAVTDRKNLTKSDAEARRLLKQLQSSNSEIITQPSKNFANGRIKKHV